MRITLCVDALSPQLTGIGRYTWELCKGLPEHPEVAELQFFGRNRIIDDPAKLLRNERIKQGRGINRAYLAWKSRNTLKSSLVHGPNYFLPRHVNAGVVTVHDLSVLRFPETHPLERVCQFERLFLSSISRASHIITDTETVRREIIDMYDVESSRVTPVPLGIDSRFRPRNETELASALSRWNLNAGEYGLCVSTFEPRKKIGELVRAWRDLPVSLRSRYPLVLAGATGWRNDELHREIQKAVKEGWLRMLGFVPEDLLPLLYAGAALFVYPSVYEGFGLPPLEAMASGVPVIAAGSSCLPEVCGRAARFIDPEQQDKFTSVIAALLQDTKEREVARSLGLDQVRQFTWKRCVEDTVAIYRSILA